MFSKNNLKKNLINFYKLATIYSFFLIISSVLFVTFFWVKIFDFSDILFFKSLFFLLITITVIFILLIILKKKIRIISIKDIIIICLLSFILNNFVYTLIPFNTSRSVSIMLIGYLYNNIDKNISKNEINEHIFHLYFLKENAIQRRLEEQIQIGNIEEIYDHYRLTQKGLITARFFNVTTKIFNTKKNYINYIER